MASLKVYSDKHNPNLWKILIAAKYNDVKVETPEFNVEAESKNSEWLKKNLTGKVPFLESDEGTIFGHNAIARYVAKLGKNKLFGSNAFDAATVEQWIEFAVSEIDLPAAVWVYPILGVIPNNPNALQKAKGDVRKAMENLNKHLLSRTYLVGQRVTLADIVVAMSLYRLYELVLDPAFRKQFQNVNRWYTTVVNQPEVKAVVGNVVLCEKMQVAKETKAEEKPAKEEKPKEKKEQPKKEEKPKKKKDEDEEEPEEDFAQEEKKKGPNPLDLLPPSKLILDEWKRTYFNNDTRSVAIPWFWEHYDKEGYSIYFGDYKYNNELEKIFMTSNLLGGFVQRLDKLRKYGFGSLLILGQEPSLEITVCFLFRGQGVPAEMQECDDYEHYNWTKADTDDAATREKINQYWAWDMPRFNQGKAFK
jgi:elongation factor 1-gamma